MSLLERLRRRHASGQMIQVAVVGAGFVGRALVHRVQRMPGMRVALVVNRRPEPAARALIEAGARASDVLLSPESQVLREAIRSGRPAATTRAEVLGELADLDVVVEATGAVEHGAQVALHAIGAGRHVVMANAETDATVGPVLRRLADEAGVVYSGADGDQPAVLRRLMDFVETIGLTTVAAFNCKGFLDRFATPRTIVEWARRQRTSLTMTTAFTDGTKMNLENAVLANATELLPVTRGMTGVRTTLAEALDDCLDAVGPGAVDYTLGGDFGGGVFVIARGDAAEDLGPYLRYYKMGDGPYYLFYRPYHLCHLEVPTTIAEVVLDEVPTIAPLAQRTEVVAVAKHDLRAGANLDGIGGFTCYGQIETSENARDQLPIGLARDARLVRDIRRDEPVTMDAVELDEGSTLLELRRFEPERLAGPRRTAA